MFFPISSPKFVIKAQLSGLSENHRWAHAGLGTTGNVQFKAIVSEFTWRWASTLPKAHQTAAVCVIWLTLTPLLEVGWCFWHATGLKLTALTLAGWELGKEGGKRDVVRWLQLSWSIAVDNFESSVCPATITLVRKQSYADKNPTVTAESTSQK